MEQKITRLLARFDEVERELGNPDVFSDKRRYKKLAQEHSYLKDVKESWFETERVRKDLEDNRAMLKEESDVEFLEVLQEEIASLEKSLPLLQTKFEALLIPPDPRDDNNTILELRAGTGGDEAALFVADCVRMYQLYADALGWNLETLSATPSDLGGFKEYIMIFSGKNVYRKLKYEGGTHRVQRVPETESQGRVHTSAVTIAVMLEPVEEEAIDIDEKDLRIDTMRASGAGGQHVNTTDSAVRITHIPTGVVACCQAERSQHKNKDTAMRLLKARISEEELLKKNKEVSSERSKQVGSGDRSGRIRTYNFSQNRITDHRINLTKYSLDRIMDGDLDQIIEPLVMHFYQKMISE